MNLDVEQLLTIDVDSEIRKLAEAELAGSWQIPAELVRRSLRAGANRVDVDPQKRALRVSDDGPPLAAETVQALGVLLEPSHGPAARHRALLELEARGEVGLVALAGLKLRSLRIACDGADVLVRGDPSGPPVARHGVTVDLGGFTYDEKRAQRWLKIAARFARAQVQVGAVPLDRGATDAIVEQPLASPLEGTVALVRGAQASRVWLLRWGIVATHTALPNGLSCEASVELGERAKGQIGAGELRHAFKAVLDEIEAQGVELALSAAADLGRLALADQGRVRMLLLGSNKLARSPEVRRVKMLPALHGPAQALEWTSIEQLQRHAATHPALFVEAEARAADAVTHQPIFVLTSAERARLSQLYQVTFAPPPQRPGERSTLSLRGLAEGAARGARAAASAVASSWKKRLPPDALTAEEKAALEVFRAGVARAKKPAFTTVELCRGDGPAHLLRKSGTLMLPRDNVEVAAAMRVVARDPSWAYPALVALLGGVAMPPSALRDAWAPRG